MVEVSALSAGCRCSFKLMKSHTVTWQIKGVRSVGRPKRRWRIDIVGRQGAVWTRIGKDRDRWRTLAEGCFLQWKDTA